MKIIVASKNPVKIEAAKQAFETMFKNTSFDVSGIPAPSGVSDQPMSDKETYTGALNRVNHIHEHHPNVDYWVGIEGGVEERDGELAPFAWIIIRGKDGRIGKGRSSTFFLPQEVTKLMREGKELAEAADIVFDESNSGYKQGTIGILTDNIIDRTRYYVEPAILALIPFANQDLY